MVWGYGATEGFHMNFTVISCERAKCEISLTNPGYGSGQPSPAHLAHLAHPACPTRASDVIEGAVRPRRAHALTWLTWHAKHAKHASLEPGTQARESARLLHLQLGPPARSAQPTLTRCQMGAHVMPMGGLHALTWLARSLRSPCSSGHASTPPLQPAHNHTRRRCPAARLTTSQPV